MQPKHKLVLGIPLFITTIYMGYSIYLLFVFVLPKLLDVVEHANAPTLTVRELLFNDLLNGLTYKIGIAMLLTLILLMFFLLMMSSIQKVTTYYILYAITLGLTLWAVNVVMFSTGYILRDLHAKYIENAAYERSKVDGEAIQQCDINNCYTNYVKDYYLKKEFK